MKTIVVSGINLFTGGTLKVLQECIASLAALGKNYKIIALVHNEKLLFPYDNVEYISFPKSRKSYFFRLYYEYFRFKKISKELKPDYWISMHDTTPNVCAAKRYVYCHNPFPFYKAGINVLCVQPSIFLLTLFTNYIYRINIKKNTYVIVQQEWIRKAFKKKFSINNILVALPDDSNFPDPVLSDDKKTKKVSFFYPATPMVHKNPEIIGEAVKILEKDDSLDFDVVLTMNGTENKYANRFYQKYKKLKNLRFVGYLNREEMNRYFQNSDCLLFPSKVETWGLPITEAKTYNKPILVSNLPYAYETVGLYDKAKFFDPDNAEELAGIMNDFIKNHSIEFDKTKEVQYEEPVVKGWNELVKFMIRE